MKHPPMYEPLSQADIAAIRETSLRVLEEVGIEAGDSEALRIYGNAGARVDGTRVYLPRRMVERAVDLAPGEVVLCGRDPKHDLYLSGTNAYTGTGGAALDVIDLHTGAARPARLRDVADIALLVEHLENVRFYLRPCEPRDLPVGIVDVNKYYAALSRTTKHVMGSVHGIEGLNDATQLAGIVSGGEGAYCRRPILSFICCWMVSPLSLDVGTTGVLLEIVRRRLPVVLSTAPMAGATAPLTLAGTLAQMNAELLSGIALTQIVSPGAPVIYGAVPSLASMRTGGYLGGPIEFGMLNAAAAQLAHAYGLPIYNSAGLTEAKTGDVQAGYEKAFSVLQSVLAGANLIHHAAGMLESMRTVSYAQYVIDNEIAGMALRAAKGIEVNEETLGFDSMRRAGPAGHYLMDDLTLKRLRQELYEPSIGNRSTREQWEEAGAPELAETARLRAVDILERASRPVLSDEVEAGIRGRFDIRL